ncbi:hypothetical protein O6H91_11G034300 [Diphasiastrum complanatum]|uniref:Uncharacterized protein n=1 Tax=Diphasiastrum complanatum TaxID=34168 RepID=A0ACC2C7T9_DIPCM|nr:hypothetical protein O6H91_Y412100 [Diphasiastrum complanatum]KAJ7538107.1 hypothetical protein O6H91_11G034300 [Diphasiastrum complanatum]
MSMAVVPEDFRCPISLELMSDPVILSTGQTYDRPSIQRWLDAGHKTCPKTKQELHDIKLIPNYALRSLIYQWAQANGVDLKKPSDLKTQLHASAHKSDKEALSQLKVIVDTLLRKLSGSNLQMKRDAIKGVRVLAKESKDTRTCIAERGAIAHILPLLSCGDPQIEENAVVALLNLSVDDENKVGLVAEGAVDAIVHALKNGSPDTRASAAVTITSLAMVDVNKATIGSRSDAIPALIKLLAHGNPRGKKEATTALYSLCIYVDNRSRAVSGGLVSLLLSILSFQSGDIAERVLALLDLLATSVEGRTAVSRESAMPLLVGLLRSGSPRAKENTAAVLCSICSASKKITMLAYNAGAFEHSMDLLNRGTIRAKRKASALLKLFDELRSNA